MKTLEPGQLARPAGFVGMFLLLAGLVAALLHNSFLPGQILFSNDGPLGRLASECHRLPQAFTGVWQDLNTIGFREGGALPNITTAFRLVLTPVGFSKFYVPAALLILGLGAWYYFRKSGLAPLACVLGGLAATLNSCFFSAACWGVGSLAITIGMVFVALGLLADSEAQHRWRRTILAGLAVGMALAEGADIGAIFSLYVAAFLMYKSWLTAEPKLKRIAGGVARVAVVAIFAGFLAAQTIAVLTETQIRGVTTAREDLGAKEDPWDWATKWSLPKQEALGLAVPGLFGFRLDTLEGGNYWGRTGRDPAWDRYLASGQQGPPPSGFLRYSGGGIYAGELVLLGALWAGLQSLRRKASVFGETQRAWIWFWLVIGVTALLFAFGRYAPFYRWLYALPYFSSIRNPTKFLHVLSFALVILFAYGMDGLARTCLKGVGAGAVRPPRDLRTWWAKATRFERRWTWGWLLSLGLSLLAWKIYADKHVELVQYLRHELFEVSLAEQIAGFSIRQVGWFVLFWLLAGGLLLLILSGRFDGPRSRWGSVLLGALLVVDLGRANQPWIIYWNYHEQYASNPIIDLLRRNPRDQRVTMFPFRMPSAYSLFEQLYRVQWLQHQFPFYNIQSLDVSQMPRSPADIDAFETTFSIDPRATNTFRKLVRRWELTNTRYLVGPTETIDVLNGQLDPDRKRFRIVTQFNVVPRPGLDEARDVKELTAVIQPEGAYALIEFSGALPRVSLRSDWQVSTNDAATLARMASPDFEPHTALLVSGGTPAPAAPAANPRDPGSVELIGYAPKDIVYRANAKTPSVLLLNDRFEPNWNVYVDGRHESLLRCNFIMRGVHLLPGEHTVEFRFQPPIGPLYVSLAACWFGLVLLGVVAVGYFRQRMAELKPAPTASPAPVGSEPAPEAAPARPQPEPVTRKASRKEKRLKPSLS